MKRWIVVAVFLFPIAGLADTTEDEIRAIVADFNDSYGANDLETYFGYYADDALLIFDQARSTVADYKREWYGLIEAGGGIDSVRISDIRIRTIPGSDAAVATYRAETATRAPDGSVVTGDTFETDVYQKIDGAWKVVTLHFHALAD